MHRSSKTPKEIAEERFRLLGRYIDDHAADLASELGEMFIAKDGLRVTCNLASLPLVLAQCQSDW